MHLVLGPRGRGARAGLRQNLPDRAPSCSAPRRPCTSQAERRIGDLQSRGYANAGLYDPQGVGGTHVMYVLHHADKPSLYKGLPDDPKISPMVALWKGVAKPLAMAALGAAAVGSLFHYITKGPNEVSKELEDEMERKDQQAAEKETQP